MSFTRRNGLLCDRCGKFCRPVDQWTHFGTKSYDYPEPLDPLHCCAKCWPGLKTKWADDFKKGYRNGDWEKSRAEVEAAAEVGLMWLHTDSIGTYGTQTQKGPYCYVTKDEYEKLSKLPRFIPKS